ncbi:MAG: FAD-linked oxidase C-terminal domain-containing protein [Burkholderiaceae bacterium]
MSEASTRSLRPAALERSRIAHRLRRVIRGEVLFDAGSRARYATDASIYQVEPVGVVIPADETDVVATMDLAREMGVPILPRGAGTSQCGQTVGEALVIDNTRHLDKILAFDAQARTVTVQPGLVLDRLNAWLRPQGLWYPVDVSTSAQATLGGMAGNNSCGSRSIAYGNMVHNVLGIDALLADGVTQHFGPFGAASSANLRSGRVGKIVARMFEIAQRERAQIEQHWPKVMRRVGGYNLDIFHPQSVRPYTADGSVNLAHMLVGSEGTLAYFQRLSLQLAPLPSARALGVVNFARFHDAMAAARHIVRLGPSAVELVDRTMIELARANPAFRPIMDAALSDPQRMPEALLLVEFSGAEREPQLQGLARLVELMADIGHPDSVVEMRDDASQKALWDVRKAGLNIMMSLKGDGKAVSFIEDCAVPLEHLAEYTDQLTEVFARHGTRGTWYAHASVGTLHVRPILDMRRGDASKMRAIAEEAAALVRRYKGAFSGEHGDGLVRSEWVRWQFGERLTRAFEEIKDLFDPDGLMNPGKIVRCSRMDDTRLFRFPPGYAVTPVSPALDWSAWNVQNDPETERLSAPGTGGDPAGGFAKAVEMCNNNGHCRKFDAQTMCPTFRVTRDERHLTRGRANTLRHALSGRLGAGALGSAIVHETMASCVSCKACRRECPTGVDMARMKVEFLHHYHTAHPRTLFQRLVANMPRLAPFASRLPWLANLRESVPGARALGERLFGVAAARALPRWRSDVFTRDATHAELPDPVGEVVLWVDTFDNYFEPENLRAARRVLAAAGYRVRIAAPAPGDPAPGRPLCWGRTYLASGMVDAARAEAVRTITALAPHVEAGATIVGLEPSCLLTMRDEFLALGLGEPAQRVAGSALLLEEFLVREARAGRSRLRLDAVDGTRYLVHGHCHQKSFGALPPVVELLQSIPGARVATIESGCCGMAGAFGYDASTYALSMKIGEDRLLPAVRAADAGDIIVADGTSCRHQIADGAQRQALHVARVLADLCPTQAVA